MVQYLYFRILKFPLTKWPNPNDSQNLSTPQGQAVSHFLSSHIWSCGRAANISAIVQDGAPQLHPYAKVLAMFAFDSYSQSKRSPRPLSRHRPCKTPFPIGNASFNKPWPNIMVLFVFDRIPSERRFPTGLFSWALLTPTNKNAKQALFLVCILQDGFW